MIYFIEGCTCAGKSTLAKQIIEEKQIPLAPEHTPAPLNETPSIVERQQLLFADFVSQFTSMIASKKDYVADFSPWGVIPFSMAYASFLKKNDPQNKEADLLQDMAFQQHKFMLEFKATFKEHLTCLKYLQGDSNVIWARLADRNRKGDNCWQREFIEILVIQYNKYFAAFFGE